MSELRTRDLSPFFDATKSAAQRSRAIAYVLIALSIYTLCVFRDFIGPDWASKRHDLMAETYACFKNKTDSDRCRDLTGLYKRFDYSLVGDDGKYLKDNDFRVKNFETRLQESVKDEVNQVSFAIPIFGPTLDGNDLWIVSGPVTLIVFLLFLAHLEKEEDVLRLVKQYCRSNWDRDMLLSYQVLSAMKSKTPFGRGVRRTIFAICHFIPVLLNILVVKDYISEFPTDVLLLINSKSEAYAELFLAVASIPALAYVSWRCYRYGDSIERAVDTFSKQNFVVDKDW